MFQHHKVTEDLHAGPQVEQDDFEAIAAAGFRSVINNRPDGEEPGQLDHRSASKAAARAGLEYRYLPVVGSDIGEADIEDFAAALVDLPKPIFAHCKSGTRTTVLWALSQVGERGVDDVLQAAARAGYDLSALRPRLEARA